MTSFISETDRHQTWHERIGHLNFQSMKMIMTHNMVTSIQNNVPPDGVFKGCMVGKNH